LLLSTAEYKGRSNSLNEEENLISVLRSEESRKKKEAKEIEETNGKSERG